MAPIQGRSVEAISVVDSRPQAKTRIVMSVISLTEPMAMSNGQAEKVSSSGGGGERRSVDMAISGR